MSKSMRKFIFFTLFILLLLIPKSVDAEAIDCPLLSPNIPLTDPQSIEFRFQILYEVLMKEINNLPSGELTFRFPRHSIQQQSAQILCRPSVNPGYNPAVTLEKPNRALPCASVFNPSYNHTVQLVYTVPNDDWVPGTFLDYVICNEQPFTIVNPQEIFSCSAESKYNGNGDTLDTTRVIEVSNYELTQTYSSIKVLIHSDQEIPNVNLPYEIKNSSGLKNGVLSYQWPSNLRVAGNYVVEVYGFSLSDDTKEYRCVDFPVTISSRGTPAPTQPPTPTIDPEQQSCIDDLTNNPSDQNYDNVCNSKQCKPISLCQEYLERIGKLEPELKEVCETIPESAEKGERQECENCLLGQGKYDGSPGAWTAIGCIPTDPAGFLEKYVFTVGMGLAGGIAFFLILWGGFSIIMSQGDPQRITHGKEIIVSAIAGLLLIIFSVFVLHQIGAVAIRIPGFGPTPIPIPTSKPTSIPRPTSRPTSTPIPTKPPSSSTLCGQGGGYCAPSSLCDANKGVRQAPQGCNLIDPSFICCGPRPTPTPYKIFIPGVP